MDTLDESLFNVFCFGYQYKVNSVSKLNKILKVRKFYLDGQFLQCIIFHHIVDRATPLKNCRINDTKYIVNELGLLCT